MDLSSTPKPDQTPMMQLDKSVYGFGALDDGDETAYWHSRTPEERLEALEFLRRINYGEAACTARLERVFEFAQLGES
jgi:hypothetical protein